MVTYWLQATHLAWNSRWFCQCAVAAYNVVTHIRNRIYSIRVQAQGVTQPKNAKYVAKPEGGQPPNSAGNRHKIKAIRTETYNTHMPSARDNWTEYQHDSHISRNAIATSIRVSTTGSKLPVRCGQTVPQRTQQRRREKNKKEGKGPALHQQRDMGLGRKKKT